MAKFRRANISDYIRLRSGAEIQNSTGTVILDPARGAVAPLINAEIAATTKGLTAAETGDTVFLNLVTGFVTTLPAPALGLRYTFIVRTAPTSNGYTIVTASSANIIKGSVYSSDLNSATDADFETSGGDTITFVHNKAVAGDRVELWCDGTNWFAHGFCTVFDAITITTAS
jgi:hypothetical protein